MLGAARLDPVSFEDIAGDRWAAYHALFIVLLVGIVGGAVGVAGGSPVLFDFPTFPSIGVGITLEVASWLIWSGVTYIVGGTLLKGGTDRPDLEGMLRYAGIAQAPGLLVVLTVIPENPFLIAWTTTGWRVAAMAVATRAAFGFDTNGRPAIASVIGFLVMLVLSFVMVNYLI